MTLTYGYTHCYGHSLNLVAAAGDVTKKSKMMKSTLTNTCDITKHIRYPSHRNSLFQNLKSELSPDTPGIRVLCPTRRNVQANSLNSVLSNYTMLWNDIYDIIHTLFPTCHTWHEGIVATSIPSEGPVSCAGNVITYTSEVN